MVVFSDIFQIERTQLLAKWVAKARSHNLSNMRDAVVWGIHVEGLAQIIREREKKGPLSLPTWFLDLIVEFVATNMKGNCEHD